MPADMYALLKRRYRISDYLRRKGIKVDRQGLFRCPCPGHEDRHPSAHVFEDKDGLDRWKCHGCGESGDLFDLIRLLDGKEGLEALEWLSGEKMQERPKQPERPRIVSDFGVIPPDAPVLVPNSFTPRIFRRDGTSTPPVCPEMVHEYRDHHSNLLAYVLRLPRRPGGRKSTPPVRWDTRLGGFVWAGFSASEITPLYNLGELRARRDAPVLVVEGEKCVDFARAILPDYVVVTWLGGSGQYKKVDLVPLTGRDVTFWPDADNVGLADMEWICEHVASPHRSWIGPDPQWQAGWDIVDVAALSPTAVREALARRKPVESPAMQPGEREPIRALWRTVSDGGWVPDDKVVVLDNNGGILQKHDYNAYLAFCHHPRFASLQFDILQRKMLFDGEPLAGDRQRLLAGELFRATKLTIGQDQRDGAAFDAALQRPVNHLAQQLRALVWDKVERPLWPYLGLRFSLWHEAATRRWFLSLVRRALEPGSQADLMLVLEGPQGVGKTTALRILASPGTYSGYVDVASFARSDVDLASKIGGKLVADLSEMTAHRTTEADAFKNLLTRTFDNYRPLYTNHGVDLPRSCVFAGSTNARSAYLRDLTGNRRFAPVRITLPMRLDDLRRDLLQLYAEAVHWLDAGEQWWLTDREVEEQVAATEVRQEMSHFEQQLLELIAGSGKYNFIAPNTVWLALELHDPLVRQRCKPQIDAIMSKHGWFYRAREPGQLTAYRPGFYKHLDDD
jgi:hypothetical protein